MEQIWCIPNDCVPFLAAATSWDQTYINLGNNFLFDTTDKILTQIRDLIELDEPSINQDLLVAKVSEKIFYDYRSIKRNVDETYEQRINEVYNQYKNIISSRAASGDMSDQCVTEIICSMEQFKNRLLIRGGKMSKSDQIIKSNKNRFKEKGIDLVENESNQLMNDLLDNQKFNKFNAEKKASFIQKNRDKSSLDKYNNDPNVKNIIDKTRSANLPIVRSRIENLKEIDQEIPSNQIEQQKHIEFSNLHPKISSSHHKIHSMHPKIDKFISDQISEMDHRKNHHHKQRSNHKREQISNIFHPLTVCTDYDPYRNYAKYKEKRLHNK